MGKKWDTRGRALYMENLKQEEQIAKDDAIEGHGKYR